jgi:hypothetical protein
MPGYVSNALHNCQAGKPTHGTPIQLTALIDNSAPLDTASLTRLQEIIGTFLYNGRAIDSFHHMLVALGSLSTA